MPDHELQRLIGRGSYGEVWLARNVMGTPRAIKVVYRGVFEHDRPFEREFAGLTRYEPISRSHEGLVNILHVGRHEPSQSFYSVMELADDASGREEPEWYRPRTLQSEIRRRERLPLEECLAVATSLASALGHLHRHGLVHRDLKPSNIIFVNGRPKIADIGLVAESGDGQSFVGTEGFVPPQGPGTPQADLYALGKVLYEASTGLDRLRFPQMPADWLEGPQGAGLIEFNEVLLTACESDPARRYQSAEEMLADLALLQVGKSVRHLHSVERRLRWARRAGALGLVVAALALGAYGLAQRQAQRERETRQRVEQAEAQAQAQLAEARLAQARALRRTGEAGQRFACLEVVAGAARVKPSVELRNEAIGALGLADLRVARRLPLQGVSSAEPSVNRLAEQYVCVDAQGNLGLRRVADEVELFRLPGEGRKVAYTGFSPDGRFLAVLPGLQRLAVWDLGRREKVFEVPDQGAAVHLRFLPSSRAVVWSAGRQPLRVCDLASGVVQARWPVQWPVWRFCCSPDGRYVARTYQSTNLIDVLDMETGQVVAEMPQPAPVQALQWHRSKPLLASGGHQKLVHLWDPLTGQALCSLEGHEGVVASLDFHPSLDLLASAGWDGTTRLWDLRTRQTAVVLQEAGDNLQFSADGRWLAMSEYSDAHVVLCEVTGPTALRTFPAATGGSEGSYWSAAFDGSGRWLACAGENGLQLFETAHGTAPALLKTGRFYSAWFQADEPRLLSSGDSGVVRWTLDEQAGGVAQAQDSDAVALTNVPAGFACQTGPWLAWVHKDHVHLRKDGLDVARLQAPSSLDHLALSPDGRWLAAAERYVFRVHLWATADGKRVRSWAVGGVARLAFSPESRFLVVGVPDEFVFWEVASGLAGPRLARHHSSSLWGPLAFSPDGKLLAVARTRNLIALHEYPGLRELATLEANRAGSLNALAFDRAGDQLAAACLSNQVKVWDLRTLRQQLATLGLDW